jgi:hypothetical protein
LLGPGFDVQPLQTGTAEPAVIPPSTAEVDLIINVRDQQSGMASRVLVEAKTDLSPAHARNVLAPKVKLMQRLTGDAAVLVIAPWLSPRTRQDLEQRHYGYLDLTGNVSFRLTRPLVVIRTEGARHDPAPQRPAGRPQLGGSKAGRLVRFLADYRPPYRALDIVKVTGLSQPYVSRLLDTLENEVLITRERRTITDVDWAGIIRARAEQLDLLSSNDAVAMLASQGLQRVLDALRQNIERHQEKLGPLAVTGPYAAAEVAPITSGGQLMLYVERDAVNPIRRELELLGPASGGADVMLLCPPDPVVFERRRTVDGLPHVALSQLAIDSLAGPGRMPAEGEAVLQYMADHESDWRMRFD